MRYLLSTSLAVIAAAIMLPAQLPPGNYLVGTQGWDANSKPDSTKNTVQLVNPYTGKATTLKITGVPSAEFPSSFVILTPLTFYMGTKTASAPAAGNVYSVTRQTNGTWKAVKLNTTALGINVGSMVQDGAYAYVFGSAIYGNTGDDAEVKRIALANGAVTSPYAQIGAKHRTGGAYGIASGMVRIGNTLHCFTFSSNATDTRNEHWAVTTGNKPTATKVGKDLPLAARFTGRGFATTGALLDPQSSNMIVVSRWGELLWRTPAGKDLQREQFPGSFTAATNPNDEAWRAVTVNTDTHALAFGDHNAASIDERRCDGASPKAPFVNNVCKPIQPSAGTYTVSALDYIPTYSRYTPIGGGCKESTGAVPCSYLNSPPTPGNKQFAFTLSTQGKVAALAVGTKITFPLGALGAPGCTLHVDPLFFVYANPSNGTATVPVVVPKNAKGLTLYTQWMVLDRAANSFGAVLSDARMITP